MLQTSFKNYDEFKELFVRTKANGNPTRRNGVLLAFLKSKEMWDYLKKNNYVGILQRAEFNSMGALYSILKRVIKIESERTEAEHGYSWYRINIMGENHWSDTYRTDGKNGICVDGDIASYRYENVKRDGRVYKMKIGKMYRHIIDLTGLKDVMPESVKLYMCEELTREWETYAASRVPSDLVLHVDDDFRSIYDCGGDHDCEGDFGSCMQGGGDHWRFYRDYVKAKAAYLTKGEADDALIVARCILFTDVTRTDTGEVIRVAERQYSTNGEEMYQRILIQKLKEGGYIDAYKKTGAGCGEATAFVDLNGNSMSDVGLSIDCTLESGGYLSYQDSFKWYDESAGVAYNHYQDGAYGHLDCTDLYYEDEEELNWDSWHDRDTENDVTTVYYHGNEYTCDDEDMDEFRYIDYGSGRYEYHHEDDITWCTDIDDYVLDEDATYSELLDEYYYDTDQMIKDERDYKKDNGWFYCEFSNDYVENEEDVKSIVVLDRGEVVRKTISADALQDEIDYGNVILDEETGIAYDADSLKLLAA